MKNARLFSLSRIASVALVISLLTTSTPAAPRTIVDFVDAQRTAFGFWYYSSGLSKLLQGRGAQNPQPAEKQSDRDARVDRIEISPNNVTIDLAQRVNFVAVVYDREGNAVGGVKIKWSAQGTQPPRRLHISPQGEFQPKFAGIFTVTAQAAGRSAQTTVTVRPGASPNLNSPVLGHREVSSRDLPSRISSSHTERNKLSQKSSQIAQAQTLKTGEGKRSHASKSRSAAIAAPVPDGGGGGWDSSNYWSADDPGNRVGDPPGATADGGAGSGNFQFAAPVYAVPGRGINISLGLSYNSRVWNKADSQMSFDNDRGWPSPGFNLGFGKLLGIGVYTGCMIVDADGTRHSYSGNITIYNWGTYGVMHTTDGSFIDYTYWTGTNGVMLSAEARFPNGTVIDYGAYSQPGGGLFPTYIEDANGNYITIGYVNNSGPRIQTVTDTLGRVINFHYDSNNLLTAITAPGLSGGTRTLVRLHYQNLSLNYSFSYPEIQSTVVQNSYPSVLDAIYYPGTQTGYWLTDYSSYGMLRKVVEERAMTFTGTTLLTEMGEIHEGSITRTESYNYPAYVGDSSGTQSSGLIDAPTYATMKEQWTPDGVSQMSEAVTTYDIHENDNPRITIITLPNGTKSKQSSNYAPGQWYDGLVVEDRTFTTDVEHPLQKSTSEWEQGAYGAPRPTRVKKFDELNNMTKAEFLYGSVYNQVTDVKDYDYDGTTILRETQTTYQNAANYTNRHIFSLPLSVEIYDGSNNRVSRTDYQYDGQTLTDTPDVVMHAEASNPYAPTQENCDWVCHQWDYWWIECTDWEWDCTYYNPYNPSSDFRGNVTQVTNYADAGNLTGAVTETKRYDITGNLVKSSSSCCEQTTFTYSADYQYAYPQSKTRGSATDWHAQVMTTAGYDFNTGLTTSATDTNGRPSSTEYDPNTLRVNRTTSSTGAHTDYAYNDSEMSITAATYLESHPTHTTIADSNVRLMNGRGQVRQEQALGANNLWDLVDTVYDNMGQLWKQTRPYRAGDTLQWTTVSYDALGRTRTVTAPEGSVTQIFYNETSRPDVASTSPGETTRVQDAWGREQWGRTDASGRLVEVVEPVFWGNGSVVAGMQTTYTYNTLGNLTQIVQGAQTRTFRYDSLSRLTAQKLAEMNPTLNNAGTYVGGNGTWSDVFTYDDRSNLTSRTDARGVKTVYNFNNDPLNRLQSVSWDTNGFGDTGNPILPAATVSYSYRPRNSSTDRIDVTQLSSVAKAGISTETYAYTDGEGRVNSKTLTLNSRSGYQFATGYIYDPLDRVSRVLYPTEYGNGSEPRKYVDHTYDVASRLSSLTFDGQTQASNILYNAASQASQLKVGTSGNEITENYSYNAQTGLLESQTVAKTATPNNYLLNLSYDYTGPNGKRTGQLTKIYNNLDNANKDRAFEYDALGRLIRATGGQGTNNTWAQRYEYDRYGNRSNVYSFGLEDYVRNFYQGAMGTTPSDTWVQTQLATLRSAYAQGQSQFLTAMQNLGETLFSSSAYTNLNHNNHEYVQDLYRAYLYREPDPGGWASWETTLNNGATRAEVRNGFAWAPEFYTKVAGISPYAPAVAVPRDGSQGIAYNQATNRVANDGWGYDAAGNQTRTWANGVWQKYQYDAANRLVQVKNDSNVTIASYTYGSWNERLMAEEFGTSSRTYYVSENGITIAEYTENGAATNPVWSRSYVYLGNRLLSTLTPNAGGEAVEYHHPDRLGTRLITNPSTGTWSEQAALPFATELSAESSGTPTKRRFTSYDRSDATKLDYAINRHYDPQQGRFTQVDRIGMGDADLTVPQTFNLYSYCTNDPVNIIDPSGLGLISFFKKVGRWIAKHWKVILIAVAVAVATLLIPGAPALFGSFLGGSTAFGAFTQTPGRVVFSTVWSTLPERLPGWVLATVFAGAVAIAILVAVAQGGLPKDLKAQVEKIANRCSDYMDRLLNQLGSKFTSKTYGDLFDRVGQDRIKIDPTKFGRNGVPKDAAGLAEDNPRRIFINDKVTGFGKVTVFELLHHAKGSGMYSDYELDRAMIKIMPADKQADELAKMNAKGYQKSTIAHKQMNVNCFNK